MRRTLARLLRRCATWLDPQRVSAPVVPLEFLTSKELADEIRKRNDVCVIFWGREADIGGDRWRVNGECAWHITATQFLPVMRFIADAIYTALAHTEQED